MRPSFIPCLALLLTSLTWACGGTDATDEHGDVTDCQAVYPDAPESAVQLLHVAHSCSSEAPDGTSIAPYKTIDAAIDAAMPGTTILIESGTYAENLTVTKENLALIGAVDTEDTGLAGIILQSPDPTAAITVAGVAGIILQSVHITGPTTAGIWIAGGSATVVDSTISDTKMNADDKFGFGVLVTHQAGIILQRTAVTGSDSTGVLIQHAEGEVEISGCVISENGRGGIRLEHVTNGAKIINNTLTGNMEVGIGVFSSAGIILQNNGVYDTEVGGPVGSADGIIVTELKGTDGESFGPSTVDIGGEASADGEFLGNTIAGSARVGVLMSGDVAGIILQNEASTNARAGFWVQSGAGTGAAGIILQDNTAVNNHYLGIAVGAGAEATITGNTISGTHAKEAEGGVPVVASGSLGNITMGDGIGLYTGATATVSGNTIEANDRAGILGDGMNSEDSSIADNIISGNEMGGIILQNVAPEAEANIQGDDVSTLSSAEALQSMDEANDPDGYGMNQAAAFID